jgi:hypothetical protein
MEKDNIPRQKKGAHFDVRASIPLDERALAIQHYLACRQRLFHVSLWGVYARENTRTFVLTDMKGRSIYRKAKVGDLIKVHLPGPRSWKGDGADWVRVEHIREETNERLDEVYTAILLRPCANPTLKSNEVAHFYDAESTNTLLVCRHKTEVIASIHGRNEQVNTDTDFFDQLRNLVVALPAKAGLSNPHWRKLAEGLIS